MRSLAGALVFCLALAGAAAGAEPVRPVTHPDHAAVALDRGFLRAVFTMRVREWPDGKPIRVFVLPDDVALHDQFSRELLGTYPYVLRGIWDRLVFTGTGTAPTAVATEDEMWRRVRSTPGAIGYARRADGNDPRLLGVPAQERENP